MLYYLFRFLESFGVPGSGMWSYISFRSLLAFILALIISARFGTYFIHWMKSHHISETQRDVSIDPYGVKKQGVPSMGGIIIIASMLVPCLLLGRLRNIYLLLMIVTTLWLGALGFLDDYIKIFRRNKEGLNGWVKILGQFGIGLIVDMLGGAAACENIVDLSHADGCFSGCLDGVQHGFRRFQRKVMTVAGALKSAGCTHEGAGDDPTHAVLALQKPSGNAAVIIKLLRRRHLFMSRDLEHGVG